MKYKTHHVDITKGTDLDVYRYMEAACKAGRSENGLLWNVIEVSGKQVLNAYVEEGMLSALDGSLSGLLLRVTDKSRYVQAHVWVLPRQWFCVAGHTNKGVERPVSISAMTGMELSREMHLTRYTQHWRWLLADEYDRRCEEEGEQ